MYSFILLVLNSWVINVIAELAEHFLFSAVIARNRIMFLLSCACRWIQVFQRYDRPIFTRTATDLGVSRSTTRSFNKTRLSAVQHPPRRLHITVCLACELALVFRMRCATPFLGTTAYYTIGSCLWKKLMKPLYYCLVFLSLQCCLPIFPLSSLSAILDIIAKNNACSDWTRLY